MGDAQIGLITATPIIMPFAASLRATAVLSATATVSAEVFKYRDRGGSFLDAMKSSSEAGNQMTTHANSAPRRNGDSLHPNTSTVDQILSISWDRKLAKDLAAEIEACTGERRDTVEEMRRFLAVKGYRELLQLLRSAREGKTSEEALKAVAHAFRSYALERPALSAAAFRTAADCPEWREAHDDLHAFMLDVFGDCGLPREAAEDALNMLRCLVRGYVLNEMMHTLIGVYSYEDSFENSVRVFVAGLPALTCAVHERPSRHM